MKKHLVEIKARTTTHDRQRDLLRAAGARHHATDHQLDHYYNVPAGRLKLRAGTTERSLIHYHRPDQAGPKDSDVSLTLFPDGVPAGLHETLDRALGTWTIVDKRREIYFIDNVKFHLDRVAGLGTFLEIEAIGDTADEHDRLLQQCNHYRAYLGVTDDQLIDVSYSDLLSR